MSAWRIWPLLLLGAQATDLAGGWLGGMGEKKNSKKPPVASLSFFKDGLFGLQGNHFFLRPLLNLMLVPVFLPMTGGPPGGEKSTFL